MALVSASAGAEVIYFNDFDGTTMGGAGVSTQNLTDSWVGSSKPSGWSVHNTNINPNIASGLSGYRVGHSTSGGNFYKSNERSIYTFQVDTTGSTTSDCHSISIPK